MVTLVGTQKQPNKQLRLFFCFVFFSAAGERSGVELRRGHAERDAHGERPPAEAWEG